MPVIPSPAFSSTLWDIPVFLLYSQTHTMSFFSITYNIYSRTLQMHVETNPFRNLPGQFFYYTLMIHQPITYPHHFCKSTSIYIPSHLSLPLPVCNNYLICIYCILICMCRYLNAYICVSLSLSSLFFPLLSYPVLTWPFFSTPYLPLCTL